LSTPTNKLLFFDKEGYPYNLTYNATNDEWGGKLYFDENSSDTFRTVCLYVFENVPAYSFTDIFDLRASQLFNYSGITFVPQTYTGQTITNIQKVNSSPLFYSKWIYGDNFDRKFPVGTSVCFNDITGSTNINLNNFHGSGTTYYNVLGTKKGAFLITTYTNNRDFNFVFSGGTVSSVNVFKSPDYGHQGLVDMNNLNYYRGKKVSVAGSSYNDGVYTYDDYNILKTKVYDFTLPQNPTYVTGSTIELDFLLMTQRPELYEGDIKITYTDYTPTGTIIEFYNYINTNIDFVSTGQTIIFEKADGSPIDANDPTFTITGFIDRELVAVDTVNFYLNQDINTIQTCSAITYTGLTYNDYIEVLATPYVTGGTLHDKRQFQVLNVTDNKIQVREYIIPETGYTYTINKVINKKKIRKLYCQQSAVLPPTTFSGYTVCYSTSNLITLTQDIVPSGTSTYFYENTISSMRNKYRTLLDRYGLNLYHYHYGNDNYLVFDGLDYNYQPYYSGATANIGSTYLPVATGFTYLTTASTVQDSDVFYFSMYEKFKAYEKVFHYEDAKLAKNFLTEIYFDIQRDSSGYGFNINLNGIDYYIPLSYNTTTSNTCINIPTTSGTTIYLTGGTSLSYVSGQEIDVVHDTYNKFTATVISYDFNSGAFVISSLVSTGIGNYCTWSINNKSNFTLNTINSFINKYYQILDNKGISVYSGYTYSGGHTGYTMFIEGQQPNITLYDVEVKINSYSHYAFIQRINNHSIVIDSSELYLVNTNNSLYNYELATGMIIDICGCTHTLNNKQFNILRITPDIIQLSYQGPFFYEYASNLTVSISSFLRSPRGYYDRDVYYKFSWDPIEGNTPQVSPDIFYYDYSGTQLQPNGELTYQGQKPLWNSTTNNLVFLNTDPNTNIDRVSDPEFQQTVFDSLTYTLERLNSSVNYNYVPVPLQVFIGFNSKLEGVTQNNLILEKIENIVFSGTTSNVTGTTTLINNFTITTGDTSDMVSYIDYITSDTYFNFSNLGFATHQHISLNFSENTVTGHTIFGNYGTYVVTDVTNNRITVSDILLPFDSSASGKTYDFTIKTEPDRIATINLYGQTEIEDDRFVQHLKLLGANIDTDVQPIFKESDINEVGIDYTILNRKRKELLSMYPEIYNFIGSYKALINSINFFGYNDLDLYEYYRCIKPASPLYGKLQRVLIQDIFVNEIPGWSEPEFDNVNYLKTNLFNLTYKITDFDGNYIDMYSLAEVQIKLTKMVYWLRKHIIPLSANILDITGLAYAGTSMYVNYNAANYAKKIVVNQENTVINFDYIQTLNIDSNYLFTINFYLTSGSTMPESWTAKIKTFHLNESTQELEPVQYIDLYKTDMLSYSFNVDMNIDPYMYIETQSFNEFGLGYTNNKLFNYNEGRNFILINNNFSGVNYRYVTDNYGYYIIADGRFYIIKY